MGIRDEPVEPLEPELLRVETYPRGCAVEAPAWRMRFAIQKGLDSSIRRGGVVEMAHLFTADEEVSIEMLTDYTPELDRKMARMFADLGQEPRFHRRFRVGELDMPADDGRTRCACVLEIASLYADGRIQDWWLAWRHFGAAGIGEGRARGEWIERQGTGDEALPDEVLDWIEFWPGVLDWDEEAAGRPHFTIEMMPVPLPLDDIEHDSEYACVALAIFTTDGKNHGFPPLAVYTFGDGTVQQWGVDTAVEAELDDVVRSITGMAEPEVVAVAQLVDREAADGPSADGGRTVQIVVERGGYRTAVTWPLDALRGQPLPPVPTIGPSRPIGDNRWIGVPPTVDVGIAWSAPPGSLGGPDGEV